MEIQKSNKPMLPASILQSITATNLEQNKFQDIVKSVSWQVSDIIDRPPITLLQRVEGNQQKMEIFLALEISKLKSMINVDARLSIQDHQIPQVAAELLELYRIESLEDFVLCFKRAAAGQYGQIFRIDGAVIHDWFKKYLDEKYQMMESNLKQEKIKIDESNEVNYQAFKERAAEFIKKPKHTNADENEYQRKRLENPYKYFKVKNLEIYATSQEHAERIVEGMLSRGELEISE